MMQFLILARDGNVVNPDDITQKHEVQVLAIGVKQGNRLLIAGGEMDL
jgi:hypothetical protein